MVVCDDHVLYKAGPCTRKAFATRDGRSLRDAAESLTEYSQPIQDLLVSFISCSKFNPQMFLFANVFLRQAVPVWSRQDLKQKCQAAKLKVTGSIAEMKARLIENKFNLIDEDSNFGFQMENMHADS